MDDITPENPLSPRTEINCKKRTEFFTEVFTAKISTCSQQLLTDIQLHSESSIQKRKVSQVRNNNSKVKLLYNAV